MMVRQTNAPKWPLDLCGFESIEAAEAHRGYQSHLCLAVYGIVSAAAEPDEMDQLMQEVRRRFQELPELPDTLEDILAVVHAAASAVTKANAPPHRIGTTDFDSAVELGEGVLKAVSLRPATEEERRLVRAQWSLGAILLFAFLNTMFTLAAFMLVFS
jgi:hypothetical protein